MRNQSEKFKPNNVSNDLNIKFEIVSAGLLNYLPEIPFLNHQSIFTKILSYQRSNIQTQNKISSEGFGTENLNEETLTYVQTRPVIICTFHLASYKLINHFLAEHEISYSLVTSSQVVKTQSGFYQNERTTLYQDRTGSSFELIDAESSSCALQMLRTLKNGKSLLIYIDGNIGSGIKTRDNANNCIINFLGQQIYARKGAGFLSHAANVPILPVLCYNHLEMGLKLRFFDLLFPTLQTEREAFAAEVTQKLYDLATPFIKRYPEQWEGWLYLHKVAFLIVPQIQSKACANTYNSYLFFNSMLFGIFNVNSSFYLFNKRDYMSYPINDHLYSLLKESVETPVHSKKFPKDYLLELLNKNVLITS